MAQFQFEILERGTRRQGSLDAGSLDEAGRKLRAEGAIILRLEEKRDKEKKPVVARPGFSKRFNSWRISSVRVEQVFFQMATLLSAGVPILETLSLVSGQSPRPLSQALTAVSEAIRGGASLGESLQKELPSLNRISIGLIRIGEANGSLPEMCRYAADLMRRKRELLNRTLGALAYPAIVILITLGVGGFLVINVLPKLASFIKSHSASVPPMLSNTLAVGNFFREHGIACLLGMLGLGLLLMLLRMNPSTGRVFDHALLRLPILGHVFVEGVNALWCRTMSVLLRSGINIIETLSLTEATIQNRYVQAQFVVLRERLRQGLSLSNSLQETALARFCPFGRAMIQVGENSGSLDECLQSVAEYAEEEMQRRIGFLAKMIEPALFVIIGTLVGFVYMAFYTSVLSAATSVLR